MVLGKRPANSPAGATLHAAERASGLAFTASSLLAEDLFARVGSLLGGPSKDDGGLIDPGTALAGPHFRVAEEPSA